MIDDVDAVLRTITATLIAAGHQVTPANSGKAGIALLRQRNFDLVITDMLMPDVDGMEILMFLQSMPKKTPVIATSGGGTLVPAKTALRGTELLADRYLHKPFEKNELLAVIETLLRKSP